MKLKNKKTGKIAEAIDLVAAAEIWGTMKTPSEIFEDWEFYEEEPEEPQDYEIRFKAKGLTAEEVSWISRYLFDAIEKELEIPYSKLEDLEIEED